MLGAAFGQALGHLAPGLADQPGVYGLIGMGAVFAGSARAPITAVVIMFELTGEYSIILPLMIAIVLATGVGNLLTRDTIYTLKLRRRGIDLTAGSAQRSADAGDPPVAEFMGPLPESLPEAMPLSRAVTPLRETPDAILPVVDDQGAYVGVITGRLLADVMTSDDASDRTVGDATDAAPTIRAGQTLADVVRLADHAGISVIPVLDESGTSLVGWLSASRVLSAIAQTQGGNGVARETPGVTQPRR
jgi:CIC family chloride channel protein